MKGGTRGERGKGEGEREDAKREEREERDVIGRREEEGK